MTSKITAWAPPPIGTWHPRGRGFGPVTYEQRLRGQPTGMFFTVSRWRYWWIRILVKIRSVPLAGCLASRSLARMQVTYHFAQPQIQRLTEEAS